MRWFTGLALLSLAAGCAGGEAESCETFDINVNVTNVAGEPQADAIVELNNVECQNKGGGSYVCIATYVEGAQDEPRTYHLVALHAAFSSVAEFVQVTEEVCGGVSTDLQLGVMMGA